MTELVAGEVNREGETIAYLRRAGKTPGVLWLGGFHSGMTGTKAEALDIWAAEKGHAYTRFDYFGHGRSSGAFRDGTISHWRDDALFVLDELTEGPVVLVGSSMGGWIALLLARLRPERLEAMLLIAPAPDFTERLMWAEMSWEIRNEIVEKGEWLRPFAYQQPYPITRALIEDGRKNFVLDAPIDVNCPIHILQGMKDEDVPWSYAVALMDHLPGNPTLTLSKQGDHRLSTPDDLKRMIAVLDDMVAAKSTP